MKIELIIGFMTLIILFVLTYISRLDLKKIKKDINDLERELNLLEGCNE